MRTFAVVLLALVSLGAPLRSQGQQALFVDGNNSALKVLKDAALEPATAMTLECWIKGLGSNQHGRILRKSAAFQPGYALAWSFQGNEVSAQYYCNGTASNAFDLVPNSALAGAWHHIAMTCTLNGTIRYFRDGLLVSEAPGPTCMGHSGDLLMGSDPSFTEEFIGSIDEVRLWNVARTPEQIKASYQLTFDAAPGLAACWHLDGNGVDSVGGHDGVLLGNAHFVPSEAPLGFTVSPVMGSWLGGTEVTLLGAFADLGPSPTVLFGEHAATDVHVIDANTLVATAPAGTHPGEAVALQASGAGSTVPSIGTFTYTPRLTATATVHPGEPFEVSLDLEAPAVAGIFLGLQLPAPRGAGPGWQLECQPLLRVFVAHAPFQDWLAFRMPVPDLAALQGAEIVAQGLVTNPATGQGSYTNGVTISILR